MSEKVMHGDNACAFPSIGYLYVQRRLVIEKKKWKNFFPIFGVE